MCRIVETYFDKLSYDLRNELLLRLAKNARNDISEYVCRIIHLILKLPDDVRKLLFVFADNDNTALPNAIASNFDKLPDDVRKLLFKMADALPLIVSYTMESNFDKLPNNIRNELLIKLADKESGRKGCWSCSE